MTSTVGHERLMHFEIDGGTFGSDWGHCGQISSHLARLVSHKRKDPLYYSNLLSSVLNELLEMAFRVHGTGGRVACTIFHAGAADRIVLEIPGDDSVQRFFEEAIALTRRSDVGERYVASLVDESGFDTRVGLLELAVDYKATLSVEKNGAGAVRLVTDLVLEEPQS